MLLSSRLEKIIGFDLHVQHQGETCEPALLTRIRREAVQTGVDTRRATKSPAGILDSMSRSPGKRNAVDMPVSAAVAEGWLEERARDKGFRLLLRKVVPQAPARAPALHPKAIVQAAAAEPRQFLVPEVVRTLK
jgi:hypothetical protein